MKTLSVGQDIFELLGVYCKHHKKFGVYISIPEIDYYNMDDHSIKQAQDEIKKACPPLRQIEKDDYGVYFNIIMDGSGVLLYDTREEQQEAYWSIVGDDGPTETNPYNGGVSVYAATISNLGITENENT